MNITGELKIKVFVILLSLIYILGNTLMYSQVLNDSLISVKFKCDAKVEVGSPFIGMEFQHSFPVPQCIL